MYSLELVITVALAFTIIGAVIGYFAAQRTSTAQQNQRQLQTRLTEMQEQQESYQSEVSEHFSKTADLLNQLTDSYRDVHNHLASGVQMLGNEEAGDSIKTLPDDDKPAKLEHDENITPPLDYAPKDSPDQPGMLNEGFGIEKAKADAVVAEQKAS